MLLLKQSKHTIHCNILQPVWPASSSLLSASFASFQSAKVGNEDCEAWEPMQSLATQKALWCNASHLHIASTTGHDTYISHKQPVQPPSFSLLFAGFLFTLVTEIEA